MKISLKQVKLQELTERLIFGFLLIILICHLLLAVFQYVIPYKIYAPYLLWSSLVLFIIIAFFSALLLLKSCETKKHILIVLKKYFSFEQIILIVFFLWFVLSIYLNGRQKGDLLYLRAYFKAHDWYIYDTFMCLLIIFPMPRMLGEIRAKQVLEILIHCIVISYSIFTLICLVYILPDVNIISFPSGEMAGFTDKAQLMLGFVPNTTGMIAATMLCLCLYMVASQKSIIKFFYFLFSILHLLVVYLSNSRDPILAIIISLAVISFFQCYRFLEEYVHNVIIRALVTLFFAVLVLLLLWNLHSWIFIVFNKITDFQNKVSNELMSQKKNFGPFLLYKSKNSVPQIILLKTSQGLDRHFSGGLNGRIRFWKAAAQIMFASPFNFLFGVTPLAVSENITSAGRFSQDIAHAHNAIVQIGVSSGVPAMALYIVFLLNIVLHSINTILIRQRETDYCYIFVGALICFLLINMAEPYLFAYFSILSCFFYLISGYVVAVDVVEARTNKAQKVRTKVIVSLLAFVLCLGAASVYSDHFVNINHNKITGKGTRNDPYIIDSKSDLCYFRDLVNFGNFFENCYFLQTNDIDLDGVNFSPVGKYGTGFYFDGIYDGGCHVIKNLKISSKTGEASRVGLFALLGGTVQNLGIESGSITGDFAGAFASVGSDHSMIINCYNNASVLGTSRAGGICDLFNDGIVINCLNFGRLEGERTADLVSYDAKLVYAKDGENNFRGSFSGTFVPLTISGETIYQKMNSGLEALIEMGVFPQRLVTFWDENY